MCGGVLASTLKAARLLRVEDARLASLIIRQTINVTAKADKIVALDFAPVAIAA